MKTIYTKPDTFSNAIKELEVLYTGSDIAGTYYVCQYKDWVTVIRESYTETKEDYIKHNEKLKEKLQAKIKELQDELEAMR